MEDVKVCWVNLFQTYNYCGNILYIQSSYVHNPLTIIFSSNSRVKAPGFLWNMKCFSTSDVFNRFKSSTTQWCVTNRKNVQIFIKKWSLFFNLMEFHGIYKMILFFSGPCFILPSWESLWFIWWKCVHSNWLHKTSTCL